MAAPSQYYQAIQEDDAYNKKPHPRISVTKTNMIVSLFVQNKATTYFKVLFSKVVATRATT